VPVRDDVETVQFNKRRISCKPERRLFLALFSDGILQKNDYTARIIVIISFMSRKMLTSKGGHAVL
jgi:hypothetical protein